MKKFLNFFPWVYLLEDYDGYGMMYDLLHKKSHVLTVKEIRSLKKYLEKPKDISLHPNNVVSKLLHLDLAFLSDEKLYIDRIRAGSPLVAYSSPTIKVESLELILNGECPYKKICPIAKEDYLLSFPCQLCYLGERCSQNTKLDSVSFIDAETNKVIQKIDPKAISIVGSLFTKEPEKLLDGLIQFFKYSNQLRLVQINLPMYSVHTFSNLLQDVERRHINRKVSFNITLFYNQEEHFRNILKVFKNKIVPKIRMILVFNLKDASEVIRLLKEYPLTKYQNILLAPYTGIATNFNQIEKDFSELKDLFLQWFCSPDVYEFVGPTYWNEIPCMSSHLLLDSELNISNCRWYWLRGIKSKFSKEALRLSYLNWHWSNSELCSRCMLKAGCFACRIWIKHLMSRTARCPIRESLLKVVSIL
jgi:hypothetical protein